MFNEEQPVTESIFDMNKLLKREKQKGVCFLATKLLNYELKSEQQSAVTSFCLFLVS